jgi:hypothetical protein
MYVRRLHANEDVGRAAAADVARYLRDTVAGRSAAPRKGVRPTQRESQGGPPSAALQAGHGV